MKKLLFAAHSLELGGIEKALVTLANYLQKNNYEVTIALEKKEGIFLKELDPNIKIIEYCPSENKNIFIRKLLNWKKQQEFKKNYKNKYDFSACFATYSLPAVFMSLCASKNNCLWGHADYLTLFENNEKKMKEFFIERKYKKFKHIIFVSEEGKESFIKIFPECKEKVMVCNNLINEEKIKKLAKEEIEIKKEEIFTFVNIGRHDEKQKKLSRLLEASKKLKEEGFDFRILMVGEGQDTKKYKEYVEKNKLNNQILFLGKKQNPYPYYKISDCVILTSDYEGFPVVFLESFVLEKPIITTKISGYKSVEGKYGMVTEKDTEDILGKMKKIMTEGFNIIEKFDAVKYNQEKIEILEKLF